MEIFSKTIKVFTVTFDKCNASMSNKYSWGQKFTSPFQNLQNVNGAIECIDAIF